MTPPDFGDLVQARLDTWKRQLIDLSRRNRLLNYRPTRSSTVEVVGEHPRQVVERLISGRAFLFDPWDPEQGEGEAAPPPPPRGAVWVPVSGGAAPAHQLDDRLQTPHDPKRLGTNLTQLFRLAEESIEEQGVNSLFLAAGMLRWRDGETESLAPLLLLPVTLRRKSAADDWRLQLRDEEVVLNPALEEKLRADFSGLRLQSLPDSIESLDLDAVYGEILDSVRGLGWSLTSDIALGIFRFQKFLMYRDLELQRQAFLAHPVIRGLSTVGHEGGGLGGGRLPDEVQEADLDEAAGPWQVVQVRDADSSQQRAILAVRSGAHLVIEGPPGTGKSQTITNIIVDAMAQHRSVLFVSEKLAALQVVRERIEGVGLGDYLLELHSDRGSKREFVESLARALDSPQPTQGDDSEHLQALKGLTEELRAYVVALHEPAGAVRRSPFEVIGEVLSLPAPPPGPRPDIPLPLEISRETLERHDHLIREVTGFQARLGPPGSHPLRGLGLRDALPAELRALEQAARTAREAMEGLNGATQHYVALLGLATPRQLGEVALLLEMEGLAARAPGAEQSLLENPAWNSMPPAAAEVLELGPRYLSARRHIKGKLQDQVLDQELEAEIARFGREVNRGLPRFLVPGFWASRKVLRSGLAPGHVPEGDRELLALHQIAGTARASRARLQDLDREAAGLFGDRWRGENSDVGELRAFADWVVEFRGFVLKGAVEGRGVEIAASGDLDPARLAASAAALREAHAAVLTAVPALVEAGRFGEDSGISAHPAMSPAALATRVAEVEATSGAARDYSHLLALLDEVREGPMAPALDAALVGGVPLDDLPGVVRRMVLEAFLETVVAARPALRGFRTETHEQRLARFQDLDEKSLQHARDRAHFGLSVLRQEMLKPEFSGQLTLVQREARKQRRILPVRKVLAAAGDIVQRIKPCFMMSPLTVAQFMDPGRITFDLVVFDEASQIPPADAVGALIRGRQCVVVGDSRQLPPTNFFGMHLDAEDLEEDDELAALSDLESILDEMATVGAPRVRLKWHYRSEHPSLIRFSNEEFYSDQPLLVFPSAELGRDGSGLQFEYVEGGVYEGRGRNGVEARRVARAVLEHARESGALTLGVGTFGVAQQQLILDELDRLRRQHPEVEWFFAREGESKFFVKNLENIQGDDRDVILLSVTYGPDRDGVVRRNFGPINKEGGWRRLNVLTTRAKKQLRVFSSMRSDDIAMDGISQGALLLKRYLGYAETGEYPQTRVDPGEAESPFERDVIRALHDHGFQTHSQVGEAGYRVDIGVVDPARPGRFLCGIECDGASYHSAITVRDRDRLRQRVLEDRGWVIHRVWSTDWFQDRGAQVERLVQLIRRTQAAPRRAAPTPEPRTPPSGGTPQGATPTPPDRNRTPLDDIPIRRYSEADPGTFGEPAEFYTDPLSEIVRAVVRVIEEEWPIHEALLFRRVAGAWGLQRAGSRVRARVDEAASLAVRNRRAQRQGDFYLPAEAGAIEPRTRLELATVDAEHIHEEEVASAIRLLLRHRAPLLQDEIVTETARLLGFRRTGSQLQGLIAAARDRLVREQELVPMGTGIALKE